MMHFRRKVCFRYKRAVLVLLGVLDVLEFLGYPGESCVMERVRKGLENQISADTGDAPLFE